MCAILVVTNDLSMGEMLAIGYVAGRLAIPFSVITNFFSKIQDASISYERLNDVLSAKEHKASGKYNGPMTIRCKNLFFRYPGKSNPFVLKDISFNINPGRTTAIIGESGCGKSTLIKLLLGLYEPQLGNIIYGNHPVKNEDIDSWTQNCSAVLQSSTIFTGSVLYNIAFSDTTPNLEKLHACIKTAALEGIIKNLPNGLHTTIGPGGTDLSGGQKQRILIARALYRDLPMLILDEATSSLDSVSERKIMDAIFEQGKDKTIIISTHRLGSVMNADLIIVMEKGRIIEQGTHDSLMSHNGKYAYLTALQNNKIEVDNGSSGQNS